MPNGICFVKLDKFNSINVVPFIDIMLVLLVIVLTTATFVAKGVIPVDLSEGKSSKKIKKEENITITIKKDGMLYLEQKAATLEQITSKVGSYKKDTPININCDKNAKFDNFVKVIDALKTKGYTNIGIITKDE